MNTFYKNSIAPSLEPHIRCSVEPMGRTTLLKVCFNATPSTTCLFSALYVKLCGRVWKKSGFLCLKWLSILTCPEFSQGALVLSLVKAEVG